MVTVSVGRLLRKTLRRPVETAGSFAEALKRLRTRADWTCLVLDVVLGPDQPSGFEILESARVMMPAVPAIMLTGLTDRELINRAAALNATYLCKPVAPSELVLVVTRALIGEHSSDSRIAAAVETTLRQHELESQRCAELLRLAVGGRSPEDIELAMHIGSDGYAYHVGKLLKTTGARTLENLVNQILWRALGES
ncbi:MAG: response regulator transcription factor [Deltaproteobacteria bacterium]|nr:response regulator transcription factor [Deltaproteobacteria bacterium]